MVPGRARMAVGAGVSLSAAIGMTATAQGADFTVDRTDDPLGAGACQANTPADCSLRQALADAENGNRPTVDRVLFQAGLSGTITLVTGGLSVSEPVDIVGPGANVLAVSGGDMQRVLDTDQGTTGDPVTISGLTLTHGYGSGVVGGGAIYSKNTYLKIQSSTISNSVSGISDYPGGGIRQVNSKLLIQDSTVSGNKGTNGGGVHAFNAQVGVLDSTISGNTATGTSAGYGYGGGIWLDQGGSGGSGGLIIYDSTIAGNHARYGGGISAYASAFNGIGGTVIADNTATNAAPDLRSAGSTPTTFQLALSLVESTSGASVADVPGFAGTNIVGVDPQLGTLGSNGGPTQTQKPSLSSPLLDKGKALTGPSDQRGLPRPFDIPSIASPSAGDGADIGAVELQAADFAVSPTTPPGAATPTATKKCKKKKHRSSAEVAKKKCKKKNR
jgi:hypothetical protein